MHSFAKFANLTPFFKRFAIQSRDVYAFFTRTTVPHRKYIAATKRQIARFLASVRPKSAYVSPTESTFPPVSYTSRIHFHVYLCNIMVNSSFFRPLVRFLRRREPFPTLYNI